MNSTPDFVQKRYDRVLSDGLPGSNADANPTFDASFIAEASDIGWGLAISVGSSYGPPVRARAGTTGIHAATAGYGIGTGLPDNVIANWAAITDGEFSLLINGIALDATAMDFNAVADMDDVAAVLQAKIRANTGGSTPFTSATVVWDATALQFKVTSGTTGAASLVTEFGNVDGGSGTDILAMLGFDSALYVPGTAAVVAATLIGVTIRSITEEGGAGTASATTTVKEGHVGGFRMEGAIKVLAATDVTAGADVYIVDATGAIVAGSGSGRTQLGTSKFKTTTAQGGVAIIDVRGLR
jgi:hypothetical protein